MAKVYLLGNSFGQIFDSLCLPCSSRSLWSSAQMEVECSEQRTIAAICQGGDDKTGGIAEILVAVCELWVDHTSDDILILPVVTHLTQPLEVILTNHLYSIQGKTEKLKEIKESM